MSPKQAKRLKAKLLNAAVAPGDLAPLINVGTTSMLDALEQEYFENQLADGISCFKYIEGDYGSGKTQFINCLAQRAHTHGIVTAIVNIGQECPFSSPLAIYRNVASSFVPPPREDDPTSQQRGIESLFMAWIHAQLRKMGVESGAGTPDVVRRQIERPFTGGWLGAPDSQTASALLGLGRRLTAVACGDDLLASDQELISWVRGESVRSNNLKTQFALHEPATDATAFQRLKTIIAFCRERLGFRGFFVAFDEGARTISFRRGTVKQRQAIENMLTMINQNQLGEFGGVMFLYSATPDFRAEVIQTYIALRDRIGSVAFRPGRPMTPLIELDEINSDDNLLAMGRRIMAVFEVAEAVTWNAIVQEHNMATLIEAEKLTLGFLSTVPPRFFVSDWCKLLEEQRNHEAELSVEAAVTFVEENKIAEAPEE